MKWNYYMKKRCSLPNIEHGNVIERQVSWHLRVSNCDLNLNPWFDGDGGDLLHNIWWAEKINNSLVNTKLKSVPCVCSCWISKYWNNFSARSSISMNSKKRSNVSNELYARRCRGCLTENVNRYRYAQKKLVKLNDTHNINHINMLKLFLASEISKESKHRKLTLSYKKWWKVP